jgi:hypothetical protein
MAQCSRLNQTYKIDRSKLSLTIMAIIRCAKTNRIHSSRWWIICHPAFERWQHKGNRSVQESAFGAATFLRTYFWISALSSKWETKFHICTKKKTGNVTSTSVFSFVERTKSEVQFTELKLQLYPVLEKNINLLLIKTLMMTMSIIIIIITNVTTRQRYIREHNLCSTWKP